MAQSEEASNRPEFESVDLDVDAAETHRYIEETIKGLATSDTDEGVKYRTRGGMLVAIVEAPPEEGGEVQSKLAYRTKPASESATRKASKIVEALGTHTVSR